MLLAIALVAFASLGLPDGVLGVAWPSIRRSFDLPPAQLGVLLASAMVGYVVSSFSSGVLVTRLGIGRLLFWSSVLMVANSLAYVVAPAWSVMVAAALLAGLGAGAIDAGINIFAAIHFTSRVVTWLHASYGVGAALGPLLMSAALMTSPGWRGGYAAIAAILAAMAIVFLLTRRRWDVVLPQAGDAADRARAPGLLTTLRRPRVWLNVALFFVYTGLEVCAGQWTYSLLTEGRGVAPAVAGAWIASYWTGLTAGRIVAGAAAGRVAAGTVLRAATLGAVATTLLLWRDPGMGFGLLALAALGCCLAPIYPLLIAETPRRIGAEHAAAAIGFQVAAAYLGTAAIPGATGVLATAHGVGAIAPCLFVTALLLLALQELARRRAGGANRSRRWRRPIASTQTVRNSNSKEAFMMQRARTGRVVSILVAVALVVAALGAGSPAVADETTKPFAGKAVNGGTVSLSRQAGRTTLTLSSDFQVPGSPDPHWQVVDSKGTSYLLDRLKLKDDRISTRIVVPAYVPDIAKVQMYCAWAEVVLGEASFSQPIVAENR